MRGDDDTPYDTEKALSLVASHFRGLPSEAVADLAWKVELAADLHKTALPTDTRNAERLGDIDSVIERHLPEWKRLFEAGYPEEMEAARQMVWRERRLANAARASRIAFGAPDHVFIKALARVYRKASGKELPAPVIGRTGRTTRGKVEPNEFSNFVLDAFRALCDGAPPSLDTIRRVVDELRMAAGA